jgi:ubiquinone/menaquinone biosynthesis C-methylase UbiE
VTATSRAEAAQRQFGPSAEKYARAAYFNGVSGSLRALIEVTQPQPDWRVLDIATGGGHCAFAFAPLVREVVATDVTPEMLVAAAAVAKERGLTNITFEPADAEALPFEDASFDLVTCRIAAHHFSDPGQAVREMARVVKPGGLVGLIDPIVPYGRAVADEINAWDVLRDPSHAACLTINGWSSLFCAAGLDAVHLDTFDVPLDFDDLMSRSGRDMATEAELRRRLVGGSAGLRAFFQPREEDGRLTFNWPQGLVVGRAG